MSKSKTTRPARLPRPLALVATVVAALVVAACGGGAASGGSTKVIKIPYMGAITGSYAGVGLPEANSVELAVALAKNELKKSGIDLQYLPADDVMDPAQSPTVARKLVGDDAVVGVAGPMFGIDLNGAGPVLTQGGLAFLTPSATAAALATHGWTMFRMVTNDDIQGNVAATYMIKVMKVKKVAVVDDTTQYGQGVANVADSVLKAGGIDIALRESVDAKATDFSATIAKVLASGADAVYMGASITTQYTFTRQLREKGFKGGYVAPDGALNPDYPTKSGPAADGSIITCQCAPVPLYGGPTTGALADYSTAYKAKYNKDPEAYGPEAFDAASLIIAALKAGKTDRKGVLEYVKNANYQGIAKSYSFQPNGEPKGTPMHIYQVKNGKLVWLGLSDNLLK